MNKFLILALAALVAVAGANPAPEVQDEASQLAIFEPNEIEIGSLSKERTIFQDFCLQARDEVRAHIKTNVNKGASFLFREASEQVLDSAAKVNEQQQAAVAKGQDMIKEDALNTGKATGGVLNAIVDGVKAGFMEKMDQVKGYLTRDNIREQFFNGCDDVLANIAPKLASKLEATKAELSQSVEDEAARSVIDQTNLQNVGCIMTGRIAKLTKACENLKRITPQTLAAIGL